MREVKHFKKLRQNVDLKKQIYHKELVCFMDMPALVHTQSFRQEDF